MSEPVSFEAYLASLGRLTAHVDPTASTPEAEEIKQSAQSLIDLETVSIASLAQWAERNPEGVRVLGLVVGLSQEKLKNLLKHRFGTAGWMKLARTRSVELITWLDEDYDLVRMTETQRQRVYDLGDILVARAGSRVTATRAGISGRSIEDEIEAIAKDLGLEYQVRARFIGRNGRTAPCDLVVPHGQDAQIVVAAKGFDSTGSKLTDAVREIEEMAAVRQPRQFVMAVIDGIGWKSREADLGRIHGLWETKQIDGMYTLATLDQFRGDLEKFARLHGLLDDSN